MTPADLVVACDMGTTSFRVLVSETTPRGELRILGCSEVPVAGYRDGDFVDLRTGSRALARALKLAEAAADVDIAAFYYNIAGSHLRSIWARGQVQVGPSPRVIGDEDLSAVLARARSLAVPFDKWILAVNPVEYAVDRVRGIVDPRGRIGSQLEVEAHLITGSRSVVRNVEHAIETAGYSVAGRAVDVLAAAAALLSPAEQEAGVLLVDMGGQSTQWVVFRHGRIAGQGQIPWGGTHLTADLAHGLRLSQEEAEQVKCQRGVALRSLVEEASPEILFEQESPEETPGLVAAILEPRLEEIAGLVWEGIGDGSLASSLSAGAILTGGGSRCQGSASLCEEVFGLPVRCRYLPPEGLLDFEQLADGQWATAVGLSLWALETRDEIGSQASRPASPREGLWRRLRRRLRAGGKMQAIAHNGLACGSWMW
jgi:cell division protein FtsA